MFKVMWLMKRKEGTTPEELMHYYENHHSKLGKKLMDSNNFKPVKYIRKYFRPITDIFPFPGALSGSEFDLAMEMWFESQEQFEQLLGFSTAEDVFKEIIEDENRFLDPHKRAIYILEEHETKFD